MNDADRLTTFQHFALIVGAVIGNGIFALPRGVVEEAGRSGWVIVLLAGLIFLMLALLADSIASRFPDMDAADWPKVLLGPVLGRIWLGFYLLKAIALAYLTGQLFSDVLSIRLFQSTPCPVFSVLIILLASLAVSGRITGFARYAELIFLISIPLTASIAITLSQGKLFHILPVIGEKPLSALLKAFPPAFYSSVGFDILWFSYPHLKKQSRSKLGVASAMLFVAVIYTLTTLVVTMSLGPERLTMLLYPTLTMLSSTEFSLIARIDNVALYIWLGTIVVTAGAALLVAGRSLEGLWSKLRFPQSGIYLGLALLVPSLLDFPPRTMNRVANWVGSYDIALTALSIIVFFILSRFRKGADALHRKAKLAVVLVLALTPLLVGCWDALPLEQRSVVLGVGVDLVEDAEGDEPRYEFTIISPIVDNDRSYPSEVRTVRARSLGEAIAIIHHTAGRDLFLGKKGFILFGRAAAEAGVGHHISQIYAFPEVRVNSFVLVADQTAKDVLITLPPGGQRVAIQIMDMMERAQRRRDSPPTSMSEFTSQIVTPGFDGVSSILTPIGSLDPRPPENRGGGGSPQGGESQAGGGGGGEGGGGAGERQYLQVDTMALWQSDRMVGEMSLLEAQYLTMAKGTAMGLLLQLRLPPDERFAPIASRMIVQIHNTKPSWTVEIVDGRPHFDLNISTYLSVQNYDGEVIVTDQDNAKKLQELMEETIAQNITTMLQKLSEAGCDAMALGQRFRFKHPKSWDASDWPTMFATATYTVKANVRIRNLGSELVGIKAKATTP